MFMQADKPGYFENYVINNRIAKAELLRSSMDRYEAAIKAEDEAIMQQTGMTADEYHDWIASLESMVAAQEEFENSEEYFNTIDNERIEELASGSGETGASAVQGPESVEAGAEADGAEGTGGNEVDATQAAIAAAPGCTLCDDPANLVYPMPLDTAGRDNIFVGRVRNDIASDCGLTLWLSGDQIRKGAALNAVQIAEYLVSVGNVKG